MDSTISHQEPRPSEQASDDDGFEDSNANSSNSSDTQQDGSVAHIKPEFYDIETATYYPSTGIRPVRDSYNIVSLMDPKHSTTPRKLLVILDLNGTLFYKEDSPKKTIHARPHLSPFLKFLFKHCRVMIWSSARPSSVENAVKVLGGRVDEIDRVWSRANFKLSEVDYHRKVLTLKDLEVVWKAIGTERLTASFEDRQDGGRCGIYNQTNTVLIDDSPHKSQLQPYNCIVLPKFNRERAFSGDDSELLKVKCYLRQLMTQYNVSAYIRRHPFDSEQTSDVFKEDLKIQINRKQKKQLQKARKKAKKQEDQAIAKASLQAEALPQTSQKLVQVAQPSVSQAPSTAEVPPSPI
ncbi:HAD-like domain-containing protein [Dissophora ornata]|nr:hypothetical protein BGZ58_011302 [Dissophora ornata]KAI8599476.1 HAD-like domain-containing protein [Dissophora ornata]